MKIIVDKAGRQVINELLDIALKVNGLKAIDAVMNVNNSIEDFVEKDMEEER